LLGYLFSSSTGIVVFLAAGLAGIASVPVGAFGAQASTQEADKTAAVPADPAEPVYRVVSPLGDPTVQMIAMAPRLDSLAGKTVCLIWNHTFKSNITLPAIGDSLKKKYPDLKVVPYTEIDAAVRAAGGERSWTDEAILQAVLKGKDCSAVISGNGGCGICTPNAARTVIAAEKMGIPGVVVTGPGFDNQARATGIDHGVPSLQVAVYPGLFDLHSNAQLQQYSNLVVVPQVIQALTKPIPEKDTIAGRAKDVVFTGSIDAVNRYFADCNWSDGLAIVPPTVEKIEEFLKYTGYSPDEEIAVLPSANLRATPWNIAANGVMAGCRPEHMPVLIAAVKAMGNPAFRLSMTGGSTHSFIHFYLVNGPLARQLQIDYGQGLIAHSTNQVIGRALGLIERNIAGYRIKESQMGTFGKTQSWVLAEDEEFLAKIGWNSYHVEKGFSQDVSTVVAASSAVWGQNLAPATSDPETVMQLIAYGVTHGEFSGSGMIDSRRYLLLTPGVAEMLAAAGYTRRGLIGDVTKNARRITYEWAFSKVHGSLGRVWKSFEAELARCMREPGAEKGKLPPWYPRFDGWEDIVTTPAVTPGRLQIIVCGDPNRNKVQTLAGGMGGAIEEIRLPANWDELMKEAGYRPLSEFVELNRILLHYQHTRMHC